MQTQTAVRNLVRLRCKRKRPAGKEALRDPYSCRFACVRARARVN